MRSTVINGAPVQVGDVVKVIAATEADICDVSEYIGRFGRVVSMDCGCGQTYPDDPMVLVCFSNGDQQEFWKEEIEKRFCSRHGTCEHKWVKGKWWGDTLRWFCYDCGLLVCYGNRRWYRDQKGRWM